MGNKTSDNAESMPVNNNLEEAWELLIDKGLTFSESLKVRNAFAEWGKKFDDNIEYDYKHERYSSKKQTGYGFKTEKEVKFFNALIDLSPESDKQRISEIMSIIFKLFDIETDWQFQHKN